MDTDLILFFSSVALVRSLLILNHSFSTVFVISRAEILAVVTKYGTNTKDLVYLNISEIILRVALLIIFALHLRMKRRHFRTAEDN